MKDSAGAVQALRPRLVATAHALGLSPSGNQIDALLEYLSLLLRWNATYNLTAVRQPEAMLVQHLADCLAIVRPVERELAPLAHRRILDVGSGAGLPGVVLALMLPRATVTCVDKVGKKTAFVRQLIADLSLPNLNAEHARVEELRCGVFDLIVSRAFSSLADFSNLTRAHLAVPGGRWLAMKGRSPHSEIDEVDPLIDVFHVEPLIVPGLDADRTLVWMRLRQ
jgi:16S rRNA (guanine527-N7)-methyltransferase